MKWNTLFSPSDFEPEATTSNYNVSFLYDGNLEPRAGVSLTSEMIEEVSPAVQYTLTSSNSFYITE